MQHRINARQPLRHALLLLLLAPIVLLAACYPELDWRTLSVAEGRFTILMPARTEKVSQPVGAAGSDMRQWIAKTPAALWSAAYTDYPGAAKEHIDEVRNLFARRPGSKLAEDREITMAGLTGRAVTIEFAGDAGAGTEKRPTVRMYARLLAQGNRLYQVAVLAREDMPAKDDLDMFFDSFKVAQ